MAEGRFNDSVCSAEEFILEHENKKTRQKTFRDVQLLQSFLALKNEERKIEQIPAVELNGLISQFIISVRRKDGEDYEPTSLRSLMASFLRYLKKNNYPSSLMNDAVFDKARKILQSKQKQLRNKEREISRTRR